VKGAQKGALLNNGHQWIGGVVPSGGNSDCCNKQKTDAGSIRLVPVMGCCCGHHGSRVRGGYCDVRGVDRTRKKRPKELESPRSFVVQGKFLSGLDLAQALDLPYPIAGAGYQQDHKHAKQRSGPLLEASREKADDPASAGHTGPGFECHGFNTIATIGDLSCVSPVQSN